MIKFCFVLCSFWLCSLVWGASQEVSQLKQISRFSDHNRGLGSDKLVSTFIGDLRKGKSLKAKKAIDDVHDHELKRLMQIQFSLYTGDYVALCQADQVVDLISLYKSAYCHMVTGNENGFFKKRRATERLKNTWIYSELKLKRDIKVGRKVELGDSEKNIHPAAYYLYLKNDKEIVDCKSINNSAVKFFCLMDLEEKEVSTSSVENVREMIGIASELREVYYVSIAVQAALAAGNFSLADEAQKLFLESFSSDDLEYYYDYNFSMMAYSLANFNIGAAIFHRNRLLPYLLDDSDIAIQNLSIALFERKCIEAQKYMRKVEKKYPMMDLSQQKEALRHFQTGLKCID